MEKGTAYYMTNKYVVTTVIEFESRNALIKNLRASALYVEENMTDEEFDNLMEEGKLTFGIETFRLKDVKDP
jgi:hypothetical protein